MRGPDALARIYFRTTEEGGRQTDVAPQWPVGYYMPILFFGDNGYDCEIYTDVVGGHIARGETVEVPIQFLYPHLARPCLKMRSRFTLREIRTVADGEIIEILPVVEMEALEIVDLVKLLADGNWVARLFAVRTLGRIARRSSDEAAALEKLTQTEQNEYVRQSAELVLKHIRGMQPVGCHGIGGGPDIGSGQGGGPGIVPGPGQPGG